MKRIFITIFCCFLMLGADAQADKLFVQIYDYGWKIIHPVKPAETIFTIARKYHVPPVMVADANGLNFQSSVQMKKEVLVPTGAYNFISSIDNQPAEARPLYYKVEMDISLYRIAKCTRVSQKNIQQWNGLFNTEVNPGMVLIIGWVLYDGTDMNPAAQKAAAAGQPTVQRPGFPHQKPVTNEPGVPLPKGVTTITTFTLPKPDTANKDSLLAIAPVDTSEAAKLYRVQTGDDQSVSTEKGAAVFYPATQVNSGFYYAFHARVKKGKIIKVYNPGTEKTIYVKVLGPLPKTQMYYNSIIGISSQAKEALGVTVEDKAWCEISYAP